MSTLAESYLYTPPFSAMNDPMEAFYETGGSSDWIVNAVLGMTGKKVDEIYRMLDSMISRFALASFAGTYEDLPMWAYYGSNFAGMCLEFDPVELAIGDFQNETLRPVVYAHTALPPLSVADFGSDRLEEALMARITRKRSEWSHEKEWRYIVGAVGPKYYLDDALKRVFLGPRIEPEHAARICEILDQRPVEVLHGEIHGFELRFKTIKPARPLAEAERVGAGAFDPADQIYDEKQLRDFLAVPFESLLKVAEETRLRPNMESFGGIDLAGSSEDRLYIWTVYKLRNGREVYHKRYFDRKLQLIPF
ncbi:DUF2971 domain-containing protein [Agrobacterium vitis]